MQYQIKRTYFKEHTEYKVDGFEPIIIPVNEKELTDEDTADMFESKVVKLFKRKIADKLANEIMFEISTQESDKK